MASLSVDTLSAPLAARRHSREERSRLTADLLRRAHRAGTEEEREQLVAEVVVLNLRVAEAVAARYRGRGVPDDDLTQTAYVGLTKAVQRFDPGHDRDLLAYAVPTIRGELQRHFRDHGWTIRPPRRVQELQARVTRGVAQLAHERGRDPEVDEVLAHLDITRAEYDEAMQAFGCFQTGSLDQPTGSDSSQTVGDLIEDPQDHSGAIEARVRLAPVVRRLSERDRRILYLRFFEDRTQEEIGRELGVTQMQVSRLLARILAELRESVAG